MYETGTVRNSPIREKFSNESQRYTYEELLAGYKVAARLVKIYGATCLPVFDRLHQEVEQHRANKSLLEIAKKVANDN